MYSSNSGPLAGLDPAGGRAHVRHAHAVLAGVDAADVLVDQLGLGARRLYARGGFDQLRHRSGYTNGPWIGVPVLRGVTHFWAFWCALAATIPLVALAPGGAARGAALVYGAGHVRAVRRAAPRSTAGAAGRGCARCCAGSTTARSSSSSPPATRRWRCSCSTGRPAGRCSPPPGPARSPVWRSAWLWISAPRVLFAGDLRGARLARDHGDARARVAAAGSRRSS